MPPHNLSSTKVAEVQFRGWWDQNEMTGKCHKPVFYSQYNIENVSNENEKCLFESDSSLSC